MRVKKLMRTPRTLVARLIVAELLTPRTETGPLARRRRPIRPGTRPARSATDNG